MTSSKVFLYFCLSFILGISLNSFFPISQPLRLGIFFLGILLILLFLSKRNKKLAVLGFCLIFIGLGVWRYQITALRILNNELGEYNDREEVLTLVGTVSGEPDIRENNVQLEIDSKALIVNNEKITISGKVLVTTNRYPEYSYGDELEIRGRLKTPSIFEEGEEDKSSSFPFATARDFNYKGYLAKEGIYSVIYWPKIKLLISRKTGQSLFSASYGKILSFKEKLRESIYQNLSPPQSSILGSMILGDKRRMSEALKEKLNITGLRHITAISGMHITILAVVLMQFLIGIGLWRGQAFYLTIALLILFIIMVGLPASAIRAGIMVGLFLFAQKIGRKSSASRAVVFAATAILAVNPLLLKFDVGFQLSFLAVMGIIYLGPIFQKWFKKIPERDFLNLRSIVAMTLSAQIFTLPILVYNFGRISLVAPITNVLILPLLPFIIGAGFFVGFGGMIFQSLGQILSWPCWLLLTYVIKIIDWFSNLSFSSITLENVHWLWLVISYLILGFVSWQLNEKQKLKFLDY